jgi:hypothetical protein
MGNLPAFRHVAWRAKQARCGANEEVVETVLTEEIDEARDDRVRSETMDSGLEPDETVLIEGRRDKD